MHEFMTIVKALADQNRVRALLALRDRELCGCQIIELLGLAPSTVSRHMSMLKQARLVEGRKEGHWMYYRLADDGASAEVREAIEWVCRSLSGSAEIRKDVDRLKQILKVTPKELCRANSER